MTFGQSVASRSGYFFRLRAAASAFCRFPFVFLTMSRALWVRCLCCFQA